MSSQVKLTVNSAQPTPTAQVLAKSLESYTVVDTSGRVISLRKPGVLAQFRLVEALGDSAENRVYMSMVLPLIYVSDIDGQAVIPVTKKIEVDALIQRLDEHGIAAVMDGLEKHFRAVDPEGDKATLKK